MEDVKVVVGMRGFENLFFAGYQYTKRRTGQKTGTTWRCSHYKRYSCNGSIMTSLPPYSNPRKLTEHSHPPNAFMKEVNNFRQKLREGSRCLGLRPIDAIAAELQNLPDEVKANIGNLASVKRDIRRQRQRSLVSVCGGATSEIADAVSEDNSNKTSAKAVYSRKPGPQKAQKDENLPSTSSQASVPHLLHGISYQEEGQHSGAGVQEEGSGESMIPKFKKEELEIEDYHIPEICIQYPDLKESKSDIEDAVTTDISDPLEAKQEILESPFETVFCGESVKIKEEVEDETDTLGVSNENNMSEVCASSEEFINAAEPPNKKPRPGFAAQLNYRKSLNENQPQNEKPRAAFDSCYICQGEALFDKSDLVDHYNSKHSGVTILSPLCGPEEELSTVPTATVSSRQPPTNPPGRPGGESLESHRDGVFISLKDVPVERRQATTEKIKSLVKLIVNLDLNPVRVKLVVSVLPKFPSLKYKQQSQSVPPVLQHQPAMQHHSPLQHQPAPPYQSVPQHLPPQLQQPSSHYRPNLIHQPTTLLQPAPQFKLVPHQQLPPQHQHPSENQLPLQHQPPLRYQPASHHPRLLQHQPDSQHQPSLKHQPLQHQSASYHHSPQQHQPVSHHQSPQQHQSVSHHQPPELHHQSPQQNQPASQNQPPLQHPPALHNQPFRQIPPQFDNQVCSRSFTSPTSPGVNKQH